MRTDQIWNAVSDAYRAEKGKSFPDHICGQVAMVALPIGKLTEVALEKKYKNQRSDGEYNKELQENAINTIVQAIRFLENLK